MYTVIVFLNAARTDYHVSGLFETRDEAELHISDKQVLHSQLYTPMPAYEIAWVDSVRTSQINWSPAGQKRLDDFLRGE